jgi:membrane protease YdiL (CAAX protease family)
MWLNVGDKFSHFFVNLKKIIPYFFYIILFDGIYIFFLKRIVLLGKLEKIDRIFFESKDLFNIIISFIAFGIILPIFEELSFRAILTKNEKYIRIGLCFFIVIFISKILEYFIYINFWIDLFLSFFIGSILFVLTKSVYFNFIYFYQNRLVFLVISSLVFALFHLGLNYSSENLLILLISIIPFFFSGFILGLVTLKHGLTYSIGLHMLVNFTGLFLNL